MSLNALRTALRRWWSIRKTIRELNRLDEHELNDLGIGRWRIAQIARRSAG